MSGAADGLVAASLGILVYLYFGYPVCLGILGRWRPRPVVEGTEGASLPAISVLVPAHDEAEGIEAKLRNTVASDYPADRIEVLVLCDGCTDDTASLARAAGGPAAGIRVIELPRMGKGRALNAGAAAARGEILVFTDANVLLAPDALRALVAPFADSAVGGVCGDKRYGPAPGPGSPGNGTARGEGLYWRYDRWVKRLESRTGSIFASDGALHAVRARLYRPIANPASADDMAISMRVVLQGFRLVYQPLAAAYEGPPADAAAEFRRKVRVTNHSVRALLDLGRPLWTSGVYSWKLLSHKLLRHLSPLCLAVLFLASVVAAGTGPFMTLLLAGQLAFLALASCGHALRDRGAGGFVLFAAPYHFMLIQLAALLGLGSLVRGTRLAVWTPRGGLEAG